MPGNEADYLPQTGTEVKNACSHISIAPSALWIGAYLSRGRYLLHFYASTFKRGIFFTRKISCLTLFKKQIKIYPNLSVRKRTEIFAMENGALFIT
jgi:hypothetical protein